MRFESARHESDPQQFDRLEEALAYIRGSDRDMTRPWVRVVEPVVKGAFLIAGGRKLDERCAQPPDPLPPREQEMLDAWHYISPGVAEILDRLDEAADGLLRLAALSATARRAVAEAVSLGLAEFSSNNDWSTLRRVRPAGEFDPQLAQQLLRLPQAASKAQG